MLKSNIEISKDLFMSLTKFESRIYEKVYAQYKVAFYRVDGTVYYSHYNKQNKELTYFQVASNK